MVAVSFGGLVVSGRPSVLWTWISKPVFLPCFPPILGLTRNQSQLQQLEIPSGGALSATCQTFCVHFLLLSSSPNRALAHDRISDVLPWKKADQMRASLRDGTGKKKHLIARLEQKPGMLGVVSISFPSFA